MTQTYFFQIRILVSSKPNYLEIRLIVKQTKKETNPEIINNNKKYCTTGFLPFCKLFARTATGFF